MVLRCSFTRTITGTHRRWSINAALRLASCVLVVGDIGCCKSLELCILFEGDVQEAAEFDISKCFEEEARGAGSCGGGKTGEREWGWERNESQSLGGRDKVVFEGCEPIPSTETCPQTMEQHRYPIRIRCVQLSPCPILWFHRQLTQIKQGCFLLSLIA